MARHAAGEDADAQAEDRTTDLAGRPKEIRRRMTLSTTSQLHLLRAELPAEEVAGSLHDALGRVAGAVAAIDRAVAAIDRAGTAREVRVLGVPAVAGGLALVAALCPAGLRGRLPGRAGIMLLLLPVPLFRRKERNNGTSQLRGPFRPLGAGSLFRSNMAVYLRCSDVPFLFHGTPARGGTGPTHRRTGRPRNPARSGPRRGSSSS